MWSDTGYAFKTVFAHGIDVWYERKTGIEYDTRTEIQNTMRRTVFEEVVGVQEFDFAHTLVIWARAEKFSMLGPTLGKHLKPISLMRLAKE